MALVWHGYEGHQCDWLNYGKTRASLDYFWSQNWSKLVQRSCVVPCFELLSKQRTPPLLRTRQQATAEKWWSPDYTEIAVGCYTKSLNSFVSVFLCETPENFCRLPTFSQSPRVHQARALARLMSCS